VKEERSEYPDAAQEEPMELLKVLESAVDQGCSDVHLVVGRPPMMRQNGEIKPVSPSFPPLDADGTKRLIYGMLVEEQRARFETNWELDSSFAIPGLARFRVNVLRTQNGVERVMRVISAKIPEAEAIGLTPAMLELSALPRGLVLVVGPTGSGKSTTLACLMERANLTRTEHIVTIEDPIEFVYEGKKCIVRQREVGQNTKSFANALRACLREDPDIILVGEMRDYERRSRRAPSSPRRAAPATRCSSSPTGTCGSRSGSRRAGRRSWPSCRRATPSARWRSSRGARGRPGRSRTPTSRCSSWGRTVWIAGCARTP